MNQQLARTSPRQAVAPAGPSRLDVFVGEVLPPERKNLLLSALPSHVKPERFERNLVIAVAQHPKLLNCDPVLVFNEVSKAAALGLYLDPQLGEAYLITGWDGRNRCEVPQLRLGYRGLAKLARQSGEIKGTPYAHEACENDLFDASLGTEKRLVHKPAFDADRGSVRLYYSVVKFDDGETDFEIMTVAQIHKIRDRSDAWRAYKDGKIKSTPWATDEEEMAKKTVLRRLLKRLPQSPEIADALRIEDEDFREPVELPRSTLLARLEANNNKRSEGFNPEQVARQADQIIDGEFHDAQRDEGFPGDRQTEDQSSTNEGQTQQQGPTLAARIEDFKRRITAAPNSVKVKALWAASANLRDDIDRADPDTVPMTSDEMETFFNERFEALEMAEQGAQGQ